MTAEVVETKKKSSKKAPKTKMSVQKESIQETGVQEPIVKEENTKDSFKDKDTKKAFLSDISSIRLEMQSISYLSRFKNVVASSGKLSCLAEESSRFSASSSSDMDTKKVIFSVRSPNIPVSLSCFIAAISVS